MQFAHLHPLVFIAHVRVTKTGGGFNRIWCK